MCQLLVQSWRYLYRHLSLCSADSVFDDRVVYQRLDTMYSRTVFLDIRTNVVRLLHTENVALLVLRLFTKSKELACLYYWFMPSKRSLSNVT